MTFSKLEELAWTVAVSAPEKEPANVFAAKIPWSTVRAIRDELEAAGYDWRAGVRSRVTLRAARATAERARLGVLDERRQAWVVAHDEDRCDRCGHTRREHRHGGAEAWWCNRMAASGRCVCSRFDGLALPSPADLVADTEEADG